MDRFVPGQYEPPNGPLAAYRQILPEQMVSAYVEELSEPAGLVVCPFAQSGSVARAAYQAGRQVILAHSNPLFALLARAELNPLPARSVDALFTRVADTLRASRTVRQEMLNLYQTRCPSCRAMLSADYFLWDSGAGKPVRKGYQCSSCGAIGEAETDEEDRQLAAQYQGKGLAYWRALGRVAKRGDPSYSRIQSLLDLYTGRNLYALLELTTRLEGLPPTAPLQAHQDGWTTILLECLDAGTSLDTPNRPGRAARLGLPTHFLERNIWRVFERACEGARQRASRPALSFDTTLATRRHEIAVIVANVVQLSRQLPSNGIELVIAIPPTPRPALWTLSYLWTAWIFGREQAAGLSHWLRRYGSDWNWYLDAMSGALKTLSGALRSGGRIVLAFRCEQRRWIEAVFIAGGLAGLELSGLALQPVATRGEGPAKVDYRLVFERPANRISQPNLTPPEVQTAIHRAGREAALAVLSKRGEPTAGPFLHAAAYRQLVNEGLLTRHAWPQEPTPPLQYIADQVWAEALSPGGITPERGTPAEGAGGRVTPPGLQRTLWWSASCVPTAEPLTDRVEMFLIQLLNTGSPLTTQEICQAVYDQFAGLLTPEEETLHACLASYAQEIEEIGWVLREEDQFARREAEAAQTVSTLRQWGEQLGFTVQVLPGDMIEGEAAAPTERDVLWLLGDERPYLFRVVWDTCTRHLHLSDQFAAILPRAHLVLPGGRSSLVSFRMRSCPLWRESARRRNWQFVKYRQLRHMTSEPLHDRNMLAILATLDPIVDDRGVQLSLL